MPSKILVPVDGSELSDRILSFLDRMPRRPDLELILVRVLRKVAPDKLPDTQAEFHDAVEHLFALEHKLENSGVETTTFLTQGEYAPEQILKAVSLLQPDLVAMSTHGRSGKMTSVRGGVAERILRHCPVPLFLGNPSALPLDPGAGFARIVVPLDGTEISAGVLPVIQSLAREHDSEVVLLNVGGEELDPFVEQLTQSGIKRVRVVTRDGDPAAEILDTVSQEGADLLAMTSHSRPDPDRVFGSVAEAVVAKCSCPLVLVRVSGSETHAPLRV